MTINQTDGTDGQTLDPQAAPQEPENGTPDPTPDEVQGGGDSGAPADGERTFPESHVKDLRKENASRRDENKQLRAELDNLKQGLGKALGFGSDDAGDAVQTVEQVTGERDTLRSENLALASELTAVRAAAKHGVNADRLLDSRAFNKKLAAIDPKTSDYTEQVEALIKAAATDDPSLAITAPSASGTHEPTGSTKSDETDASWFKRTFYDAN